MNIDSFLTGHTLKWPMWTNHETRGQEQKLDTVSRQTLSEKRSKQRKVFVMNTAKRQSKRKRNQNNAETLLSLLLQLPLLIFHHDNKCFWLSQNHWLQQFYLFKTASLLIKTFYSRVSIYLFRTSHNIKRPMQIDRCRSQNQLNEGEPEREERSLSSGVNLYKLES